MSHSLFAPDVVWIGSDHAFDLHEAYLCFRSPANWELAQKPGTAILSITADSRYKLWVNGRFVARGPARSHPHAQAVDQLEIAEYLHGGHNTLAVQVYQPGYSHFSYVHRGMAGLLAQLVCDGRAELVTGPTWRTRRDFSFTATVPPVSIYISGVEKRNLNLANNWIESAYDDADWSTARIVAPLNGYPWTTMQIRSLPLLLERELETTLVETRIGSDVTADQPDPHLALRDGWLAAEKRSFSTNDDGWFPVSLNSGESAYWLFDLGRGHSCQGWAEVKEASGHEQLAISYSEKTDNGQVYLSDPATYCRVRMTDCYQLRPGDQRVEPFALRGGRLLLFQLTGPTSTDFQVRFHTRGAEYPLSIERELTTSDPLLDQIITMCEETLRACLLDGFVDNPWRESAQWIGDALPNTLIMAAVSEDTRPTRRVLELAAQGAYPDGVLPSVLPSEAHAYVVVDFNFQWVELLHIYAGLSGDEPFVTEMWPALVRMLDRFAQDVNDDGLLISQPGRRLFLDWSPASKQEPNAVYNLHFLLALQQAAALATARGATEDARQWQQLATQIQRAVRNAFWVNGRWYDDQNQTTFSQLAASLALLTETTSLSEAPALLDALATRSLDPDDTHDSQKMVLASPYMHHRIFTALRQYGRSNDVVKIIRLRWGRWVQMGYPTTWENWAVDFPDGSQCHAFSAHPRYHLAEIARELGGL